MLEISNWLHGDQDYAEGVALYMEHGKDQVMKGLFALTETSFTRKKLVEAMEAIAMDYMKPVGKLSKNDKSKVDNKTQSTAKTEYPKEVLRLIRERSSLHEELFHITSKSDRHKLAVRILAIGKKLDGYFDHGTLPGDQAENEHPEDELPTNGHELFQMYGNNKSYITKNKGKENKAGEVSRRERRNVEILEMLKSMSYEPVS